MSGEYPANCCDPTPAKMPARGQAAGTRRYRPASGLPVNILCSAVAALCLGTVGAAAQSAPVSVELNKLEQTGADCRSYMVITNGTDAALDSLSLDLVVFDDDGVIDRRLAVELGPVDAGRTRVKVFDMAGLGCDGVSRILINDVLACEPGTLAGADCAGALTVSARGPVDLIR